MFVLTKEEKYINYKMMFVRDKAKMSVMNRYFSMFMFGVLFVFLEAVQRLLVSELVYYILLVLELIAVYFLIKNFAKKELG